MTCSRFSRPASTSRAIVLLLTPHMRAASFRLTLSGVRQCPPLPRNRAVTPRGSHAGLIPALALASRISEPIQNRGLYCPSTYRYCSLSCVSFGRRHRPQLRKAPHRRRMRRSSRLPELRKAAVDNREQLEARHIRHVEIREKDIGDILPNFSQCGESVFYRSD